MADETKAPEQSAPRTESGPGRPGGDRPRFGGSGRGPGGPPREGGGRPGGDRPRFGGGGRGPGGPGREGGGPGGRKFFRRKKVCKFCVEKIEDINYKDYRLLGQFVAESGKIVPRRLTGVCAPHQHRLSSAIKQARNIALLPFAGRAS